MQKLADTTYPIEPLLKQRWSPRAFAARPVEIDKLLSLWEAARWSASCANQQPWYFIVATKGEKLSTRACSVACAKTINCGPRRRRS
jgi:nitroreductase